MRRIAGAAWLALGLTACGHYTAPIPPPPQARAAIAPEPEAPAAEQSAPASEAAIEPGEAEPPVPPSDGGAAEAPAEAPGDGSQERGVAP